MPSILTILVILGSTLHVVLSEEVAHWQSDGSSGLKITGKVVNSNGNDDDGAQHGVMWVDGEGENSGEHYWTIHFTNLNEHVSIGLSNQESFKPGYGSIGLLYGGNLHDGGRLLTSNFGPSIPHGKSSVGILASFTKPGKLQVYFFINKKPVGLAYKIDASILPNLYPMVRFEKSKGSATITKESEIPGAEERIPSLGEMEGIGGNWIGDGSTVIVNEKPVASGNVEKVKLQFEHDVGDKFKGSMKIGNSFTFDVIRKGTGWVNIGGIRSTKMGVFGVKADLEKHLPDLIKRPESVTVDEEAGQLRIVKGKISAVFKRDTGTPSPYTDNPLQTKVEKAN